MLISNKLHSFRNFCVAKFNFPFPDTCNSFVLSKFANEYKTINNL